jgi:hypothetical protein
MDVKLSIVALDKPDDVNVILGHTHFIMTVDDLHEALVAAVPNIAFGLAFCEASGPRLVRWSGTDDALVELARNNAQAIGAGHSFLIVLGNAFPINVLPTVRRVPEVCRIYCATANPLQVIVAESDQGRGIVGVIDGQPPLGIEDDAAIQERRLLLRTLGYKL